MKDAFKIVSQQAPSSEAIGLSMPNMADMPEIACDECKSNIFLQAVQFRKMSGIVSPTGREELIPIPFFVCAKCGKPFIPNEQEK